MRGKGQARRFEFFGADLLVQTCRLARRLDSKFLFEQSAIRCILREGGIPLSAPGQRAHHLVVRLLTKRIQHKLPPRHLFHLGIFSPPSVIRGQML